MKPFDYVAMSKPKKSVFDLSHERKFTCDMGYLTPVFLQEVIPGDHFRVNMETLVRMQPMLSPVMHRINCYTHFFFVPNRLIWSSWEQFITGGIDGSAISTPKFMGSHAEIAGNALLKESKLADYLGLPVDRMTSSAGWAGTPEGFSQLPFRAYLEIYNTYYRDQNLTPEITYPKTTADIGVNHADATKLFTLRKRCWEKDYFTSCLPFAQRGNPVSLPLGNVTGIAHFVKADGTALTQQGSLSISNTTNAGDVYTADGKVKIDSGLTVGATLINDLRKAYAIQRWFEKSARGGARYIEQILIHFGVKSSDARLQRPQYLGGGKLPLQISEVLQTSQAPDQDTATGSMYGHGVTAGINAGFSKSFEEHGFIIGIQSILPRTAYQLGTPRLFNKTDRFDYFFPDFAHIGEAPVYQREIYYDDTIPKNSSTFGYQPRYSEYRFGIDSVHGNFRSSLNYWHMGRIFSSVPALNETFVNADPTSRIFAVTDVNVPKIICQTYADVRAARPIPYFGEPMP